VRGLRLRISGGVVPVWVYAAAILGLAAAMLIVVIGDREQHNRRITGEWNCGEETGGGFWVRFAVDNGSAVAVSIDNGGCLGVDARTDGQWWYWGKWDPDGRARAEIRKDLRTG
jgi:hypothetical protein